MNKDYAGLPFAVGTITGIRGWSIDSYGRLEGSYGQVWRPGENVARCPSECSGVEEDCTCGFYAYHDTSDSHLPVRGVIEGYGTVVIGTKGFRCSKARIIGLWVPYLPQREVVARLYPDLNLVAKKKHLRDLLRYEGRPTPESMGDDFWTLGTKPLEKPAWNTGGLVISSPSFTWSGSGWQSPSPSAWATSFRLSDAVAEATKAHEDALGDAMDAGDFYYSDKPDWNEGGDE